MAKFKVAFVDLTRALALLPLATSLALDDLASRYRRTGLGPLWIALGQVITIGGIILLFSSIFKMPSQEVGLYLAISLPIFTMFVSFLSDMPNMFINARPFIEAYDMPWMLHALRRAIGYFFVFLHQMVFFFILAFFFKLSFNFNAAWIVPGLFLLLVAGCGVGLFLAVVGSRYRDVQPAVAALSGALFLFSPVMWKPEALVDNHWIVQLNPIYYLLEVTRAPLLEGRIPSMDTWVIATALSIGLFLMGMVAFALGRPKLYHWML